MEHCGTKRLETKRLVLRRFTIEDAGAMYNNWASDDEVTKFLMWKSHGSVDDSKKILTDWLSNYHENDYYEWAIILKEYGDEPIGSIGVVHKDEQTEMVHIGYCIGRKWWKQGITSEALEIVIKFLFEEVKVKRIESRHDPKNEKSGKVMMKCGMQYEGTKKAADWNNQGVCDSAMYAILAKDYFANKTKEDQYLGHESNSAVIDIIIMNGILVTMEGKGVGIINDGAVGIKGNRIVAVGESKEVLNNYKAHRYMDATNKVIMPGLIDAHMHSGLGILRGLSQDINNWMQQGLWPFSAVLKEEPAILGSMMNLVEVVKAGTTTVCDFDRPMEKLIHNHVRIGLRARVASTINEMPPDLSRLPIGALYPLDSARGNELYRKNVELFEKWHGFDDNRVTVLMGPQGPDMVSSELLGEIRNFAQKNDTMIHMHVAQGDREINQMLKRYGKRSIQYLDEIGYLNNRLMAVHLTEATKEETQLLAKRGASMILCSGSIGIIDGIVPPSAEFLEVSKRLALGSDQAPGNNCNNIWNEMKFTAILNKCKAKNPAVYTAGNVLRMATIDAAKAIGMGDEIGSIKVGKKADIILVDMNEPCLAPIYLAPLRNIIPNLVYSAKGSEVVTSIIDGKVVMENKKILTVDEKEVVSTAHEAAKKISELTMDSYPEYDTPLYHLMVDDELY